jgi:hypothetical protein
MEQSFFNWYSGGVESNWVHSALRLPIGLLGPPRVIMMMEKLVEWWLAGAKPKYSEKTYPNAALSTTNPTCCPYANPGRRGGKPATNRYGTAWSRVFLLNDSSSGSQEIIYLLQESASCTMFIALFPQLNTLFTRRKNTFQQTSLVRHPFMYFSECMTIFREIKCRGAKDKFVKKRWVKNGELEAIANWRSEF